MSAAGLVTSPIQIRELTHRRARHVDVHRTASQMHEVGHEYGHRVRRRGVTRGEAIRLRLVARVERARDSPSGCGAVQSAHFGKVTWSDEPADRM